MSTPEQIQADIERQREQLAQTVDQLGHKLDVKAQTREKVAEVKDRATTDDGKPRPEVLGAAAAVVRRHRPAHLAEATIDERRRPPGRGAGAGPHRGQRPLTRTTRASPTDPGDLTKRSWFYVLRKTMHEFTEDQCTDLAAALTYYAVLSIFPAMLALISVLGVLGQGQQAVDTVEDTLSPLLSDAHHAVVDHGARATSPSPRAPESR